jgi:predicted HTH domain antitoxin
METVDVKLPSELLRVANLEESSLSQEAARLLVLELYREDQVSLGRAAELCQTPFAAFMDFWVRQPRLAHLRSSYLAHPLVVLRPKVQPAQSLLQVLDFLASAWCPIQIAYCAVWH